MLGSIVSESPVKIRHESQLLLSSWTEQHQRTGRLVLNAYSSSYSERNIDEKWSSQEWKSDDMMEARTGRLVNEQPPVGSQSTRTELLYRRRIRHVVKSRSFLHRVNDRVRKIQDQSSKYATQDSNKHSVIWLIFFW